MPTRIMCPISVICMILMIWLMGPILFFQVLVISFALSSSHLFIYDLSIYALGTLRIVLNHSYKPVPISSICFFVI